MLIAASLASHAASILSQALQGTHKPGKADGKPAQSFASDLDSLLSGGQASEKATGVGAVVRDLKTLGQDVLSILGGGTQPSTSGTATQATRAYASANALGR